MAKTYILEPTEATFTASGGELNAEINFDWTALDGYPGDEAEDEEIRAFLTNTFSGSKFEMMYGDEPISLIYVTVVNDKAVFNVSGELDGYPVASADFHDLDVMRIGVGLAEGASVVPVAGTYTVSIYTETEDPEPTPTPSGGGSISKNFAFVDHPRNDLAGIADILAGGGSSDEGGDEPEPEPEPEPDPEPSKQYLLGPKNVTFGDNGIYREDLPFSAESIYVSFDSSTRVAAFGKTLLYAGTLTVDDQAYKAFTLDGTTETASDYNLMVALVNHSEALDFKCMAAQYGTSTILSIYKDRGK